MKKKRNTPKQVKVHNIVPEIQEVLNKLNCMRKTPPPLKDSSDLLAYEIQVKNITDQLRGLMVAHCIQDQLNKPDFKAEARQVAQSSSKKNARPRS